MARANSFKDEQKLGNLKEQLRILTKEVADAGAELSRLYKEREDIVNEGIALAEKTRTLTKEFDRIKESLELRERVLAEKETILNAREEELLEKAVEFSQRERQFAVEIKTKSSVLDVELANKRTLVNELAEKVSSLGSIVESQETIIEDNKETIASQTDEIHLNEQAVRELTDVFSTTKIITEKDIQETENKLTEVENRVKIEIEKIKLPEQNLREREIQLEIKKRDLDILENRYRARWRKQNEAKTI